jgi:hypothetical protein
MWFTEQNENGKRTVFTTQLIYRSKRCEVTGEWRRLHNRELYDLNCSPNIGVIKSKSMRLCRHITCRGHRAGAHTFSVGRPEGERPLVRPRRWKDNIKMDLREAEWRHGLD